MPNILLKMARRFFIVILATIFVKGVTSQITGIRLTAGTNAQSGRVEVLRSTGWGTICEDGWENNDAAVVCRALGFGGGTGLTGAPFGRGTLPISLFQVLCSGTEANLNACPVTTRGTCNNGGGAGVQCSATGGITPSTGTCTTPATNVQLANNKTGVPAGIGVLEVQDPVSRTWGAVCNDRFDVNAARVICRMLCYNVSFARPLILPNTTFETRLNVMVTNVSCTGRETDFFRDCRHNAWGLSSCTPSEAVAITCLDNSPCYPYNCYKRAPSPIVDCNDTYIEMKFSLLEQPTLTLNDINVIPRNCTVFKYYYTSPSGERFVAILSETTSCAINVTFNATHFLYHATLYQSPSTASSAVITRDRSYNIDVICALPRHYNVSKPFELITESITAIGLGRFFVVMRFWYTDFFRRYYTTLVRLPVGDCLNVTVELITTNPTLKIGVPDCWVTPNPISTPYMYRDLFVDRRLVEMTTIMYPLDALRIGFQYRVFQFVNYTQVTVHCTAVVCDQNDRSPDCLRNYAGRRKREASRRVIQVDSDPISIIINSDGPATSDSDAIQAIVPRRRTTKTPESPTTRPTTSTKPRTTTTTPTSSPTRPTTTATTTSTTPTTTTTRPPTTETSTQSVTTTTASTTATATTQTPTITTNKPTTTTPSATIKPTTVTSVKQTTASTTSEVTTTTYTIKPTFTEAKPIGQTASKAHTAVKSADGMTLLPSATGTTSRTTPTPSGSNTTTSGTSTTTSGTTATPRHFTTSTFSSSKPMSSTVNDISSKKSDTAQGLDMSLSLNMWRNAGLTLPLEAGTPVLPGTVANVSVNMYDPDRRYNIDVTRCWVAPVGNEKLYVELIRDKLITEKTLAILKMDNVSLGFCFKTPNFNGFHSICVHCEVLICNDEQCLTLSHIRSQHISTEVIRDFEEETDQLTLRPYEISIKDSETIKISSAGRTLLAQQGVVIMVLAITALC